jgi:DNA-binding MarR family transcriptional regulator
MSLKGVLKKTRTYEIGLAQVLATKTASHERSQILKHHDLSSMEWFLLGIIYGETPTGGIRVTDLAAILGVKSTYVTSVLRTLKDKGYVQTREDPGDARVRLVVTTKKAGKAVDAIEESLQNTMEQALGKKVTSEQFRNYVYVLQEITRL